MPLSMTNTGSMDPEDWRGEERSMKLLVGSHYENRLGCATPLPNRGGVRCAFRKTDLALKDCDHV